MALFNFPIFVFKVAVVKVPWIDSVPQAIQVACHHGDAQTNKPTKRDGRVVALITLLHNADENSADSPIG